MIEALIGLTIATGICIIAVVYLLFIILSHADNFYNYKRNGRRLEWFIALFLFSSGMLSAAYPLFILVPLIGELISRIG